MTAADSSALRYQSSPHRFFISIVSLLFIIHIDQLSYQVHTRTFNNSINSKLMTQPTFTANFILLIFINVRMLVFISISISHISDISSIRMKSASTSISTSRPISSIIKLYTAPISLIVLLLQHMRTSRVFYRLNLNNRPHELFLVMFQRYTAVASLSSHLIHNTC